MGRFSKSHKFNKFTFVEHYHVDAVNRTPDSNNTFSDVL